MVVQIQAENQSRHQTQSQRYPHSADSDTRILHNLYHNFEVVLGFSTHKNFNVRWWSNFSIFKQANFALVKSKVGSKS